MTEGRGENPPAGEPDQLGTRVSRRTLITAGAVGAGAALGAGTAVAFRPPRGTGRRREVVLVASATSALLIFFAISSLLPAFDGFVSNWHPPTYTAVTRLVDPILEFVVFVVLTLVLSADLLLVRARRRRAPAGEPGVPYEAAPNEMVVLPPNSGPA